MGFTRMNWQEIGRSLLKKFTKSVAKTTPNQDMGTVRRTPNGGFVGLRDSSKSGIPVIDVNQPGIDIRKLRFHGD